MKTRLKNLGIILLFAIMCAALALGISGILPHRSAFAEQGGGSAAVLSDTGLISEGYLSAYAYTTEEAEGAYISSYSVNGGNYGQNLPSKALDGDFSTFWESGTYNSASFSAAYTITFSDVAQADRIIYSTRQDDYPGRGYPSVLTIYSSAEAEGENFDVVCRINSSYGGNKVIFDLGGTVQCRRLRLGFTELSSNVKLASAAEIIVLRPEEEAAMAVRSAFADYNCLHFTPEFSARAEEFVAQAKNTAAYAFSNQVKLLADRAAAVLSGEVKYDPAFELSTAGGAQNPIARHGNITDYARNNLKMVWMGTNRQVTGIGAASGRTLTVFVEAEEGDPLPSLECTQFNGTWRGWRSGPIALSRGINFITVPDYYGDWADTVAGGPLYIVNPYTEEEQSANVKVYIEGGYSFPVYRGDDDADAYLSELENYLEKVESQGDYLPDMTEITTDNLILTVTATQAAKQYAGGGYSPDSAAVRWGEYLHSLFDFCGIYAGERADARSQYLNVNIRVMQPLSGAAAYAFGEHIGIYPGGSWEVTCLRAENFGWGVTHELGHMMEISERTWGEYTNNMWSQFDKCRNSGEEARGNFAAFLSATVKDGVPYSQRDAYSAHTDAAITWWLIESRYPGFWGRFENNYRYADRAGITDPAELHVYFASLAAGADLSYYFERIGFNWNGSYPFEGYDSASEQFKSAISAALSAGTIKNDPLKLWYLDAGSYNYTVKYGDKLAMYGGTEKVDFTAGRTSAGVTLLMNGADDYRHLGFEILRGNAQKGYSVIGFTYGRTFTDTAPAEGEDYMVRAYDRALGCSALSAGSVITFAVARVDGQDYYTLEQAVQAAPSGGTVYLLADAFAANIAVSKPLTVAPLSSDVNIYLASAAVMFNVARGASLTLTGGEYALALDGLGISHGNALIVSEGALTLGENVVVRNCVNTSEGGALRINNGTLEVNGAIFQNNSASNGGAISSGGGGSVTLNISSATFAGNTASDNGGAIYANCYVNLIGAAFTDNSAAYGGAVCVYRGGVFTLSDCTFAGNSAAEQGGALRTDGKITFGDKVTEFSRNSAQQGGAIYVASANDARRATVSNAEFFGNAAELGAAIYMGGYSALGTAGTSLDIQQGGTHALYVGRSANLPAIAGTLALNGNATLYAPLNFGSDFSPQGSSLGGAFTLSGSEQSAIAYFASDSSAMPAEVFAVTPSGAFAAEFAEGGTVLAAGEVRAFLVTLSAEGQSTAQYFVQGHSFVLPQAAEKQGYTFSGWEYGGRLYAAGESFTVDADALFTAKYQKVSEGTGETPEQPQDPETPDRPQEPETPGAQPSAPQGMPAYAYAIIAVVGVLVVALAVAIGIYVHARRKK